ncbi:MAG: type II toxin-antitoxin system Phd/YefM family antitoxin [Chthoniobacterales bacterium]
MITVNMHEAKTRLSQLVKAVEERGETVILQRHGKPIVRLLPADPCFIDHFRQDPRLAVTFHKDPALPVPDEAWPEEHR